MSKCITCEDMKCEFKLKIHSNGKVPDECMLDLDTAVMVLKRLGVTTCEIGCGERKLSNSTANDNLIIKIKRRAVE